MRRAVLLVVLCVVSALANLPPYHTPGSFLASMSGVQSFNDTRSTLFVALWDASSGQNYTNVVAHGYSMQNFVLTTNESMAALTFAAANLYNHSYVAIFKYAPRTVPSLVNSCALPVVDDFLEPSAFVLNGITYVMYNESLYSVAFPGRSYSAINTAPCKLTLIISLSSVGQYTGFCSLSVTPNHVAYVSGTMLVELWWSSQNHVSITSQANVPGDGVWMWLQEDTTTSDFYFYTTMQNYTASFWKGTRSTTRGAVAWSGMPYWNSFTPGDFMIDSRYNSLYDGPLFCSTDSFNDQSCSTVYAQSIWQGPRLAPAFQDDSGLISATMYDANCH